MRPYIRVLPWSVLCVLAVGGCQCGVPVDSNDGGPGLDGGPDGGDGGNIYHAPTLVSLTITPENAVLLTDGGTPVTQPFSVTGHYSDSSTFDVTTQTGFSLDNTALGTFSNNNFISNTYGGTANVTATVQSVSVSTPITVKIAVLYNDPGAGLPPNPPGTFSGPQTDAGAGVPELVYPNDKVMLPPNLTVLETHFLPGTGNNLFEVSFENDLTDVRVYTRCTPVNAGCVYIPDSTVWPWLAATNRGGAPLVLGVRGVNDSALGNTVGVATPSQFSFSPDDVVGGVYYWTTTTEAIMRFTFGVPSDGGSLLYVSGVPSNDGGLLYFDGGQTQWDTHCIGCHALTRDGTKLVTETSGQNGGQLMMVDVANNSLTAPFGQNEKSIFESWNPTGTQFVGVYGDNGATDYNLHIQDGVDGGLLLAIPGTGSAAHPADHPDWSPLGDKIVYTSVGVKNTLQKMGLGSIQMVTYDAGWSAPVTLIPTVSMKNHYYPAFAPDQNFIIYDESTCPPYVADGGWLSGTLYEDSQPARDAGTEYCNADSDPTAKLWVLPLDGGLPIALDNLNAQGVADGTLTELTNSFPKWSPFISHGTAPGSRLMWVTFSSTRSFGLKPNGLSGSTETPTTQRLWMAAIDPDKIALGVDPSYPAFYVPFQDPATSNHIAQWAESIVDNCVPHDGVCTTSADCCAGFTCYILEENGLCELPGSCAGQGNACGGQWQCCDGLECIDSSTAEPCTGTDPCICTQPIE